MMLHRLHPDDMRLHLQCIANSFEHNNPEADARFIEDCLILAHERMEYMDWNEVEHKFKHDLQDYEEFVLCR